MIWGLESAVAVAQQDRHVVVAGVGDGEVGAAVAAEVPRHDGFREEPDRVSALLWKVPSPLPRRIDMLFEP